jgi:hypothetical protein
MQNNKKTLNDIANDYLKFYLTYDAPNGTRDIVITSIDGTIVGSLDEAVFGGMYSFKDSMGNLTASFYGETVGMLPWDDESIDAIESGELSDIQPLAEVTLEDINERLAVSPVLSSGEALNRLEQALIKALKAV